VGGKATLREQNSSRSNRDGGNGKVGGMRHGRKEQPGVEVGEEVRPFQEKRRRGVQRDPSGVRRWCGGHGVPGQGGQHQVLGGVGSSWGTERLEELSGRGGLARGSQQPPLTEVR